MSIKQEKDLIFQVLDWSSYDDEDDEDEKMFVMRLYGRTKDDKTVFLRVENYTPYFFVEIPKHWRNKTVNIFIEELKRRVPSEYRDSLREYGVIDRYKFWGFTNNTLFHFVRLVFNSHSGFRAFERVLRRPIYNRMLSQKKNWYKV